MRPLITRAHLADILGPGLLGCIPPLVLQIVLWLTAPAAHADTITVGKSVRLGDGALIYDHPLTERLSLQAIFVNEGKQPCCPNINRPLSADLAYRLVTSGPWQFSVLGGATSSAFSVNGSENGYHQPDRRFSGNNVGASIAYRFGEDRALVATAMHLRYRQADVPQFESFEFGFIGLQFHPW